MENTNTTETRGWLKRFSRRSLVIAGVGTAVFVLIAGAAIAAIFLRAEVSGQATSGAAVAFEWSDASGSPDVTYSTRYAQDTTGDGSFDSNTSTIPGPLTCTAAAVAGELQVDMGGGWLPGEACVVTGGLRLSNPSSVNIDVIEWVFASPDIGLQDTGAPVEVWIAATAADGSTDVGLPATLAAGEIVEPGLVTFYIDDAAPFSTTFDFDGTAIIGQTTR